MSVPQCNTCQHWQRRGGIVLPAGPRCVALEDEAGAGQRMVAIVTRMARTLAASNACPAWSPFPLYPDAYRAEDLPDPPDPHLSCNPTPAVPALSGDAT